MAQLENIKGEELEKEEIDYVKQKRKKQELIEELKLPGELKTLIEITDLMLDWQDVRKKEALLMLHHIETVLKQVAKKADIDVELLRWLGPFELTFELLDNFNESLIRKRINNGMGNFYTEQGFIFLEGDDLKNAISILQKQKEEINELDGITGSPGRAVGKVRICMNKNDLEKFNQGEILVTSMTRPEFVPAMKKASGIITDEGGITCHAAIVARELKIPCLIATKNATKILKNGMLVELRANHSMVRIIEKS